MTTALRYIQIAATTLAALCFAACSGSDDNDVREGVLRISASKNTVLADGADAVTLKVMYGSANVSDSQDMQLIQTFDGKQTELSYGVNTFTAATPGTYTLKARYKDGEKTVESENSAVITATTVSGETKDYAQKLLFMQFTSVGCSNCPAMSSMLHLVQGERPGCLVPASFHLQYDPMYVDPMWLKMNDSYRQKFSITGLPTGFINLRPEAEMTSEKSSINTAIDKVLKDNPATCGVAIVSTYDSSKRDVKVEAKVTANVSDTYRYLILLVEDKISYFQLGVEKPEAETYQHNNVVRAILSSNVYGERLNQGNALQPGVEAAASRSTTLDASWNPENMRVVVAALTSQDDGVTFTCNNVNECALGQSATYQFNE